MDTFHILYADDTLLLCGTEREQLIFLRVILLAFEDVYGLKINLAKSSIFSVNTDIQIEKLAGILGCKVESFPATYLGRPFGARGKDTNIWQALLTSVK